MLMFVQGVLDHEKPESAIIMGVWLPTSLIYYVSQRGNNSYHGNNYPHLSFGD